MMKLAIALLVTLLVSGCGVTASSKNPGFVHFDTPDHSGLKNDASFSLGPRVLGFAARHIDDDPDAKALLESLDGIQVNVFTVSETANHGTLNHDLAVATADAFDEQWSPIVRVVEDDSRVHIFVKENDGILLGLAIVAIDDEELVFVNLMGEINPDRLASLSSVVPGTEKLSLMTARAQ